MKLPSQLNIQKLKIDWEKIGQNLLSTIWQLAITTLIFYLLSHFGHKLINNYLAKHNTLKNKRSKTIAALINSLFQYTLIFFYLFGVLSILGVPVSKSDTLKDNPVWYFPAITGPLMLQFLDFCLTTLHNCIHWLQRCFFLLISHQ